jgi:hypothetical protein
MNFLRKLFLPLLLIIYIVPLSPFIARSSESSKSSVVENNLFMGTRDPIFMQFTFSDGRRAGHIAGGEDLMELPNGIDAQGLFNVLTQKDIPRKNESKNLDEIPVYWRADKYHHNFALAVANLHSDKEYLLTITTDSEKSIPYEVSFQYDYFESLDSAWNRLKKEGITLETDEEPQRERTRKSALVKGEISTGKQDVYVIKFTNWIEVHKRSLQ